jgi:hypothetical protein
LRKRYTNQQFVQLRVSKFGTTKSLDVDSDDDEEESNASSEATINPQREFFGNSGFDTQEYFPGLKASK